MGDEKRTENQSARVASVAETLANLAQRAIAEEAARAEGAGRAPQAEGAGKTKVDPCACARCGQIIRPEHSFVIYRYNTIDDANADCLTPCVAHALAPRLSEPRCDTMPAPTEFPPEKVIVLTDGRY